MTVADLQRQNAVLTASRKALQACMKDLSVANLRLREERDKARILCNVATVASNDRIAERDEARILCRALISQHDDIECYRGYRWLNDTTDRAGRDND